MANLRNRFAKSGRNGLYLLDNFEGVAHPRGFEPLTPRFVVWCSIQLSYGCSVERADT